MKALIVTAIVLASISGYLAIGAYVGVRLWELAIARCPKSAPPKKLWPDMVWTRWDEEDAQRPHRHCDHVFGASLGGTFWPFAWALLVAVRIADRRSKRTRVSSDIEALERELGIGQP